MGPILTIGVTAGAVFLLAYIIAHVTIPVIIRVSESKHLFDTPDDHRKLHTEAIPTLGGIAIFIAFLLSYSVSPWANSFAGFSYLVAALLLLFFSGLKDDLVSLSPRKKIGVQLTAAGLVIFGCDTLIADFYGVLGAEAIPLWLGIPLTFFAIMVVINALNLLDGIDGLAAGIGMLASGFFAAGFLVAGEISMALLSLALAGALLGFLRHNFSPASIFMGDTGSMLIGFLIAIQAIQFLGLGGSGELSGLYGNSTPILVVAFLALPLYDTLRVVFKRLRRGKSMFTAGQDHVHHELLRMGISHKRASLTLYGLSLLIACIGIGFSVLDLNINVQLAGVIGCCLLVYPTNGFKRRVLHKVLGIEWNGEQYDKWGVDMDPDNIYKSINGNGFQPYEEHSSESEKEREMEEMVS